MTSLHKLTNFINPQSSWLTWALVLERRPPWVLLIISGKISGIEGHGTTFKLCPPSRQDVELSSPPMFFCLISGCPKDGGFIYVALRSALEFHYEAAIPALLDKHTSIYMVHPMSLMSHYRSVLQTNGHKTE